MGFYSVIPATVLRHSASRRREAGIQKILVPQADPPVAEKLDSHFHGNDMMT